MDNEEIYKKIVAEMMQTSLDSYSKAITAALFNNDYTEIKPEKDFIKRKVLGEYSDEVIDNYYS